MKATRGDWAALGFFVVVLAVFVVGTVLTLVGGDGTHTRASPSASARVAVSSPEPSSTPAMSPSAATWPSPTATLKAQTMPGTLVFTRVVKPAGPLPTDHANYDIYLVRSDGAGLRRLTDTPDVEEHAYWSPDGKRVVYGVYGTGTVWVMNANGSGKVQVGEGGGPHWSPDGKQIVYEGGPGVCVMSADGSGKRCVFAEPSETHTPSWASNGMIVFLNGGDLFAVNPDGSGSMRLTKDAGMLQPTVSPDGTTVAAFVPKKDSIVALPLGGDAAPVTLLHLASHYFPDGGQPTAAWTSDGKKLVLGSSNFGETYGSGLYLVNADGSGLSRIPSVTRALCPAWRPASASPGPSVSTSPAVARPAVLYSRADPPSVETGAGTAPSTTARVSKAGTIGWEFRPRVDIKVTALGCFDAGRDGLARAHRVGIFDAETRRLLASVTVRPKSRLEGFFRWESLETPLVLTEGLESGRHYLVGTEDRGTLETLYTWHNRSQEEALAAPGEQWAEEIGPVFPGLYVSRPSQAAFTAPTRRQDLWNGPPWFSPNFKFKPVSASSPTP